MRPLIKRTAVAAIGALSALALVACSGTAPTVPGGPAGAKGQRISVEKFDEIVAAGPVASAEEIAKSPWAQRIKKQGFLKVGGTKTSPIFSFADVSTGRITGFDAGMAALLSHYILGGDSSKVKDLTQLTQASSDTRETLVSNGTVDAVVATYSVTPARMQKVNFAGPYYASGAAVMVKADNDSVKSVKDLAGKKIATQSNSTSIPAIEKEVEKPEIVLFEDNPSCIAAVKQGRVDGYVLDQSVLLSAVVNDKSIKVVGEPFTKDLYGIGLSKNDPDAVEFVNGFLKKIEADGTWQKLFDGTIKPFAEGLNGVPPKIGELPAAKK